MHCSQCGKEIQRESSFCVHCGARQIAEPPAAQPPIASSVPTHSRAEQTFHAQPVAPSVTPAGARRKPWMWGGVATLIIVLLGGVGFWGWTNKLASDETARKLAEVSEVSQRRAAEAAAADARRVAAEDLAERAEIAAAQAALNKRIIDEENLAKARIGMR